MGAIVREALDVVNLIHCSLHKCLTVYYRRIMHSVFNRCVPWRGSYRHYNSHLVEFYDGFESDRVASVNNRSLDLDRLGEFRLTRFIRDPRDLVVSGYFYHRRGAEAWTTMNAPTATDWYFANGVVPDGLQGRGVSFADYLQALPEEEGLLAEIEFRRRHFESMLAWPAHHPHILSCRYEDIIGNETELFRELFEFYGLSATERWLGDWFARRHSAQRRAADRHVRDPSPGQWRQHFTSRVRRVFDAEYGTLIKQLGYSTD